MNTLWCFAGMEYSQELTLNMIGLVDSVHGAGENSVKVIVLTELVDWLKLDMLMEHQPYMHSKTCLAIW